MYSCALYSLCVFVSKTKRKKKKNVLKSKRQFNPIKWIKYTVNLYYQFNVYLWMKYCAFHTVSTFQFSHTTRWLVWFFLVSCPQISCFVAKDILISVCVGRVTLLTPLLLRSIALACLGIDCYRLLCFSICCVEYISDYFCGAAFSYDVMSNVTSSNTNWC